MPLRPLLALLPLAVACAASAKPVTYEVDPMHTFPSFEADHMGLSTWRGKFNKTSGRIVLDKATGTGTVDLTVDATSIDFGLELMNEKARSDELFDTAKHPQARYTGRFEGFADGAPTRVVGNLTLRGVTKPVALQIGRLKCVPHPMFKRELCGADALAVIQRDEFGMDAGKAYGFKMDVILRIQVEAIATE